MNSRLRVAAPEDFEDSVQTQVVLSSLPGIQAPPDFEKRVFASIKEPASNNGWWILGTGLAVVITGIGIWLSTPVPMEDNGFDNEPVKMSMTVIKPVATDTVPFVHQQKRTQQNREPKVVAGY